MKVKLNLRDILADNRADFARVTATVDLEDLLQCTNVGAWPKFDLFEILENNRMIAHVWTISDVHEVRPDLTDDQAWKVLTVCFRDLDSRDGISWDTVENAAEKLFGTTTDRFKRFAQVVCEYTDYDAKTNLIDLLADSLHWCRKQHVSFDDSLEMARAHFGAETKEGGRP